MANLKILRGAFLGAQQSELAVFASNVFDRMSNQPAYQSLSEEVTKLGEHARNYASALSIAASGGLDRISLKNEAKATLLATLERLSKLMELHPDFNTTWANSAGMEVTNGTGPKKRVTEIPAPENLQARPTGVKGEVELSFQAASPKLVQQNAIEHSIDDGVTWQNGKYSTLGKVKITDLPSGVVARFRVRSLGKRELLSPWAETWVLVL